MTACAPLTASRGSLVTVTPGSAARSAGSRVAGPHSTTSAPSLGRSSALLRATRLWRTSPMMATFLPSRVPYSWRMV